ncbi:signal peptidase II [Lacticaseibacillus saniviri]|uniref:Lipoprotein signal peptidase n=3 Tax=Lacticaseibacillus saniviri TaxID=931533 RepID=A0A0R2MZE5_9LACO|nr:signal peptidase II [Lacticaseibacillus saniviri]KRO18236.1 lipoprotein signal peptidase [Lacticaseibacillus saniviri JCM 17471 = DSM 24301]
MIYLLIALAVLGIDYAVKLWVVQHLAINATQVLIPNVVSLTHIKNTGAAYGMLAGKQWVFYIITVIALIIVATLWRGSAHKVMYRLGLALILAGALGNFIDRVRFQYVTDMFQLDFINFAIFNVADMSLTIGVILVLIHILFFDKGDTL